MTERFKYDSLEILKKRISIKKEVVDEINRSIPLIEDKKEIEPDINNWIIVYPPKYEEENTNFFDGALENFQAKIRYGNNHIDGLMKIILSELFDRKIEVREDRSIDNLHLEYFTCGDPIKVVWNTYALPNFLNNPSLGKQVEFEGYYNVDNYEFKEFMSDCEIERDLECHRFDFSLGFRLLPRRISEEREDNFDIDYHIKGIDSGWGSEHLRAIEGKLKDNP